MHSLSSGYTRFPDWLLDSMDRFDPVQWKILCLIVRKNIGFSHPTKEFSVRYIAAKIGENKSTVHRHLKRMLEAGLILEMGRGSRGAMLLDLPSRPADETLSPRPSHPQRSCVPRRASHRPLQEGQVKNNSTVQSSTVQRSPSASSAKQTFDSSPGSQPPERCDPFASLRDRISPAQLSLLREHYQGDHEGTPTFDGGLPLYLLQLVRHFFPSVSPQRDRRALSVA